LQKRKRQQIETVSSFWHESVLQNKNKKSLHECIMKNLFCNGRFKKRKRVLVLPKLLRKLLGPETYGPFKPLQALRQRNVRLGASIAYN